MLLVIVMVVRMVVIDPDHDAPTTGTAHASVKSLLGNRRCRFTENSSLANAARCRPDSEKYPSRKIPKQKDERASVKPTSSYMGLTTSIERNNNNWNADRRISGKS